MCLVPKCYLEDMSSGVLVMQARRRAGITQAELANRVGTTQSAIARIESGATESSLTRVEAIVEACGFRLEVQIADIDTVELATIRRNLDLEVNERVSRTVRLANFIRSGQSALRDASPRDAAKSDG
jgi:predicted transcriptional regulator